MKLQKRHIVLAALVLALSAAVYLNWQFSGTDKSVLSDVSKELGAATYVNADTESTPDEVSAVSKSTSKADEYFAKAALDRQQAQDKAIDIATQVIKAASSTEEAKAEAARQLTSLENNIVLQNNIESILKGKGLTKCICYISETGCTVSVLKTDMTKDSPLIIKDAVQSQLEVDFNKITIIEI